jgi:cob(I)alamin adenosyltransferase
MASPIRPWWPEVADELTGAIAWADSARIDGVSTESTQRGIHMARAALNRAERALVAHMPTEEN